MAKHLKTLVATSTAPFRIVLNHMNLLSQTRPEFDRVCVRTTFFSSSLSVFAIVRHPDGILKLEAGNLLCSHSAVTVMHTQL